MRKEMLKITAVSYEKAFAQSLLTVVGEEDFDKIFNEKKHDVKITKLEHNSVFKYHEIEIKSGMDAFAIEKPEYKAGAIIITTTKSTIIDGNLVFNVQYIPLTKKENDNFPQNTGDS